MVSSLWTYINPEFTPKPLSSFWGPPLLIELVYALIKSYKLLSRKTKNRLKDKISFFMILPVVVVVMLLVFASVQSGFIYLIPNLLILLIFMYFNKLDFKIENLWIAILVIGIVSAFTGNRPIGSEKYINILREDSWSLISDLMKVFLITAISKFFIETINHLEESKDESISILKIAQGLSANFPNLKGEVESLQRGVLSANKITNFINKLKATEREGFLEKFKQLSELWDKILTGKNRDQERFATHFLTRYIGEEVESLSGKKPDSEYGLATNFGFYSKLVDSFYENMQQRNKNEHYVIYTVWDKPARRWFNFHYEENDTEEKYYCNKYFCDYKNEVLKLQKHDKVKLFRGLVDGKTGGKDYYLSIIDENGDFIRLFDMEKVDYKMHYSDIYNIIDSRYVKIPKGDVFKNLSNDKRIVPYVYILDAATGANEESIKTSLMETVEKLNGEKKLLATYVERLIKPKNTNEPIEKSGIKNLYTGYKLEFLSDNELFQKYSDEMYEHKDAKKRFGEKIDFTIIGQKENDLAPLKWLALIKLKWYGNSDLAYLSFYNDTYPGDKKSNQLYQKYLKYVNEKNIK